jgi:hypothetical protein
VPINDILSGVGEWADPSGNKLKPLPAVSSVPPNGEDALSVSSVDEDEIALVGSGNGSPTSYHEGSLLLSYGNLNRGFDNMMGASGIVGASVEGSEYPASYIPCPSRQDSAHRARRAGLAGRGPRRGSPRRGE